MPLTVRAWLRYLAPLTILAAIASLPMLYIASRVGAAQDIPKARAQLRIGWILAATAWIWQFLLVAAVTPAVHAVANGRRLSQLRALTDGLLNLMRGIVPWLIVVAAVVLGGIALVVPGLLLLVLLSLTGASARLADPPPAALVDSVAIVRRNLGRIALIVAIILIADLAVGFVAQHLIVPSITKKVAASKLLPLRTFVRTVVLAIAALSPLAACALAAAHARLTARQTS